MEVIWLIIFGIIGFTLTIIGALKGNGVLGFFGGYILSGVFMFVFQSNEPTAIDVYRGKTTLQITYKDSVAMDSVVVFKN